MERSKLHKIAPRLYWFLERSVFYLSHNPLLLRVLICLSRSQLGGFLAPMVPLEFYKRRVIGKYARQFKAVNFVETGTYTGDALKCLLPHFKRLYSIELSETLYKAAAKRFANEKKITLIQGNSGEKLADIVPKLKTPTLFWLDAHYSQGITAKGDKDCPIYEELMHVLPLNIKKVILIDDAECFKGEGDYPTIKELKSFIHKQDPSLNFEVRRGIMRIH